MKMQHAEKTWEMIRGQAGQCTALRTSGYSVKEGAGSSYMDSLNTIVEQEDRVVLRNLQEQTEGEEHLVFSGQVVCQSASKIYHTPERKIAPPRVARVVSPHFRG